jgi:hypothetical protein
METVAKIHRLHGGAKATATLTKDVVGRFFIVLKDSVKERILSVDLISAIWFYTEFPIKEMSFEDAFEFYETNKKGI